MIGIRELQREASRVVRSVELDGATYRVAVQGRPTDVVLRATSSRESGATVGRARASDLYRDLGPDLAAAWVAEIDSAREAQGQLGDAPDAHPARH
jgi:antitoxin (DNA-binding transcriptional repressor) of toxin-antitoxin stability system